MLPTLIYLTFSIHNHFQQTLYQIKAYFKLYLLLPTFQGNNNTTKSQIVHVLAAVLLKTKCTACTQIVQPLQSTLTIALWHCTVYIVSSKYCFVEVCCYVDASTRYKTV